jgi:hypothetical protein
MYNKLHRIPDETRVNSRLVEGQLTKRLTHKRTNLYEANVYGLGNNMLYNNKGTWNIYEEKDIL